MKTLTAVAAILLLAAGGVAQTPEAAKAQPAELTALETELAAENAKYRAALKAVTESPEFKKAVADKDRDAMTKLRGDLKPPGLEAYGKRALAAAEKHQGDDRARILIWTVNTVGRGEAANQAMDALIKDHVGSPRLLDLVATSRFVNGVGTLDAEKTGTRLAAIREGGATNEIKAYAAYADGMRLQRPKDASDEDKANAKDLIAVAAKLAEGSDLADRIAAPEFEQERLQIGMPAPDIAGEDLDGKAFKLSDYKGKVVVLDFWGDW